MVGPGVQGCQGRASLWDKSLRKVRRGSYVTKLSEKVLEKRNAQKEGDKERCKGLKDPFS